MALPFLMNETTRKILMNVLNYFSLEEQNENLIENERENNY